MRSDGSARHHYAAADHSEHDHVYVIGETVRPLALSIQPLTDEEKEIIRCGSLINYNRKLKNANKG